MLDKIYSHPVLSGVTASLIWFFIGYSAQYFKGRVQYFHTNRLWGLTGNNHRKFLVILSSRAGPSANSTPRASTREIEALVKILSLSRKIKLNITYFGDLAARRQRLSRENLLIIGGPKANSGLKTYWSEVSNLIPCEINVNSGTITYNQKCYQTTYNDDGSIATDYALLVKIPHIDDDSKIILIAFGMRGVSSPKAVDWLKEPSRVRVLSKKARRNSFVGIIKNEIVENAVISSSLEEFEIIRKIQ